jgi:hypothetical protein
VGSFKKKKNKKNKEKKREIKEKPKKIWVNTTMSYHASIGSPVLAQKATIIQGFSYGLRIVFDLLVAFLLLLIVPQGS